MLYLYPIILVLIIQFYYGIYEMKDWISILPLNEVIQYKNDQLFDYFLANIPVSPTQVTSDVYHCVGQLHHGGEVGLVVIELEYEGEEVLIEVRCILFEWFEEVHRRIFIEVSHTGGDEALYDFGYHFKQGYYGAL